MKLSAKSLQLFLPGFAPLSSPRKTVGSYCVTPDFEIASWVLIGVPDDRGVANNFGRAGAKEGPNSFRELFFSHSIASISPKENSIFDLGNFLCPDDLKISLDQLKEVIKEIKSLDPKKRILVVGGGHDIAYSEIAGCLKSKEEATNHHIVNVDAHSDVRPLEKGGVISSGTPFYRLIEEEGIEASHYHPFGLQKTSNSSDLCNWMSDKQVSVSWLENMLATSAQIKQFSSLVESMKDKPWHCNIDLDAFALSVAPGVSAPSIIGVDPAIVFGLDGFEAWKSLQSLGIYELNPTLDIHQHTARLAAKMAYLVLSYCA